jgi:biotin carboxylase
MAKRNVLFVAPFPTEVTLRFARATAKLENVRLLGIVHTPPSGADRKLFADIVRVTDPLSAQDITDAARVHIARHGAPHRLVGVLEALMVQLAEAREKLNISGTRPKVAEFFRDKAKMKEALRDAGLPVAKSRLLTSRKDAEAFAEEAGFPMVVKPPSGMGAKSTYRVASMDDLFKVCISLGASKKNPLLAEEFLRGEEYSFETITTRGEPQAFSISRYLPSCLEVLEQDWVQWCCLLPKEVPIKLGREAKDMGYATIRALGLDSGMTHMEWFRREDGSLAIGEIAQRPPGANISLMTGLVHGIDPYRAWARAVVDDAFDGAWERKNAAGCAFLRGTSAKGGSRVAAVTGVAEAQRKVAGMVAEVKLPQIGAPKAAGYEGDGYVVLSDPSTEKVKKGLKTLIETIRVHYTD